MAKLPSADEIREWITENPELASKRDVARAFGVKASLKSDLGRLLREIKREARAENNGYRPASIVDVDEDGKLIAVPMGGDVRYRLIQGADAGVGDEVLVALLDDEMARFVRKIERNREEFIARFEDGREGGRIHTIKRGRSQEFRIDGSHPALETGDLVLAESVPRTRDRFGNAVYAAKILARIGNQRDAHILSQLSVEEYNLRSDFPDAVTAEAAALAQNPPSLDNYHDDLTHLDFITIDPIDARDRDDAIYVEATETGWTLWVAIADVSQYVRVGSELDEEAFLRGNSVYFPDRVIPMSPEALSGDLCSLHENVVRPVIYTAMDIGRDGQKTGHRFGRGRINSRASLAYERAQALADGDETDPLLTPIINEFFTCYFAMAEAATRRGALHLDLPEQHLAAGPDGHVIGIGERERKDAHKAIENAMIAANVAAAETLEEAEANLIYRIHENPKPEKLETLRNIARTIGYKMARSSTISVHTINALLDQASDHAQGEAVSMQVLRTLRQARYAAHNGGHFGLALKRYAHFTSPIRRYSDLIVHRALIGALGLGEGGYIYDIVALEDIAGAVSKAERIAVDAERDTINRFVARYLERHIGDTMEGRISGVSRFGFFVTLDEVRADGVVPLRILEDHYTHDRARDILRGKRTGRVFKTGQKVSVKLIDTNALTGAIELQLVSHEGEAIKSQSHRRRPPGKKHAGRKRKGNR